MKRPKVGVYARYEDIRNGEVYITYRWYRWRWCGFLIAGLWVSKRPLGRVNFRRAQ